MNKPHKHFDEDELELLPPEKAATNEAGTEDKGYSRKAKNVRKKFWSVVKKAARQVPIMEDVVAGYYCAFDSKTPAKVRLTLIGALAYFVLPLDFIPDFILGIGFGDDLAILAAALKSVHSHITNEHRLRARQAMSDHDISMHDASDDSAGNEKS